MLALDNRFYWLITKPCQIERIYKRPKGDKQRKRKWLVQHWLPCYKQKQKSKSSQCNLSPIVDFRTKREISLRKASNTYNPLQKVDIQFAFLSIQNLLCICFYFYYPTILCENCQHATHHLTSDDKRDHHKLKKCYQTTTRVDSGIS